MLDVEGVYVEAVTSLPKTIRVLIADDHRLFAQALEAILVSDERLEVAGHARNGREAVELAAALRPDVVLMDIAMPVMDGFQATREIRKNDPAACILMLTGSNANTDVDRARKAGAAGYVTKDRIAAELIEAIVELAARDDPRPSG
jgi:DNA-binding NarL/FixJ family response regulator